MQFVFSHTANFLLFCIYGAGHSASNCTPLFFKYPKFTHPPFANFLQTALHVCVVYVCLCVCVCMSAACMCTHLCAQKIDILIHLFIRIFLVAHFPVFHFVVIFSSSEFTCRALFFMDIRTVLFLPARASEQGNVIGLVSVCIYIYIYIYIYVIKKKL